MLNLLGEKKVTNKQQTCSYQHCSTTEHDLDLNYNHYNV